MFVIRKDIFLITLILDVSKWYDRWYAGNLIAMKTLHLQLLLAHYEPKRFEECDNLYKERVQFLVEVQEIMDRQVTIGGYEIWTI